MDKSKLIEAVETIRDLCNSLDICYYCPFYIPKYNDCELRKRPSSWNMKPSKQQGGLTNDNPTT